MVNNDNNYTNNKETFIRNLSIGDLLGDLTKKKVANTLKINILTTQIVHPWGVEPQSMEPESIILSIELWVHIF